MSASTVHGHRLSSRVSSQCTSSSVRQLPENGSRVTPRHDLRPGWDGEAGTCFSNARRARQNTMRMTHSATGRRVRAKSCGVQVTPFCANAVSLGKRESVVHSDHHYTRHPWCHNLANCCSFKDTRCLCREPTLLQANLWWKTTSKNSGVPDASQRSPRPASSVPQMMKILHRVRVSPSVVVRST